MQRGNERRGAVGLTALALLIGLPICSRAADPSNPATNPPNAGEKAAQNLAAAIQVDDHIRLSFGEQQLVLARGLQPSMLCTASGALVVQAQVPEKPFPSSRMTYFSAMSTVVSRD